MGPNPYLYHNGGQQSWRSAADCKSVTNVSKEFESLSTDSFTAFAVNKTPAGEIPAGHIFQERRNMSNSSLISKSLISPNKSSPRNKPITRITPHCFVGQVTLDNGLRVFKPTSKQASCNYLIDKNGKIGLCVDESDRSWCSSSSDNDNRAVTIEVASDSTAPYTITDAAYNALVDLMADICKRNGKKKLTWINDKAKALAYKQADDEMLITVHRWFKNKECPGQYIMDHLPDIVNKVNARLNPKKVLYRVQVGAFSNRSNAEKLAKELTQKGYDTIVKEE